MEDARRKKMMLSKSKRGKRSSSRNVRRRWTSHRRRSLSTSKPMETRTKWRSWLEQAAPPLVMPMQRQKLNFNAKSRSSKKRRSHWRRRCVRWKRIFRKSIIRSSTENRMFHMPPASSENVEQEKDPEENSQRQGTTRRPEWKKEESDGRVVPFGITVNDVSFPRKPGLQKQGDVAGRGASLKKTERRTREETRPKKDPPRLHTAGMRDHDPTCFQQESSDIAVNSEIKMIETNLPKEPPESFNWNTANSKRVKEEHSPRKDPPSYDQWKLALEHHKVFMDKEVTKTTAISNRPSSTHVPLKDYMVSNIV